MEEDKGMLEQKVENLKTKLSDHEQFEEMLEATHKLRLQQDEQVKLQDRLKEQKAQLLQAEHRLQGMVARLNEKRQERAGSSDVRQQLDALEAEVNDLEKKCMEVLPQQIQAKQKRMEELQGILGDGQISDAELGQMSQQQQHLARAVQQLEERKRATQSNPDDKLAMFRQQANLVAKKKDALLQRLASVSRERGSIEAELQDKAGDLDRVKDRPVLKGDDFRKYASELRGKTAQYKRMKAELSELRAEWGARPRGLSKPLALSNQPSHSCPRLLTRRALCSARLQASFRAARASCVSKTRRSRLGSARWRRGGASKDTAPRRRSCERAAA